MKKTMILLMIMMVSVLWVHSQDLSADTLVITQEGNVGINLNNPQHTLDVSGDVQVSGEIKAYIDGKFQNVLDFLIPVGTIMPFAGDKDHIPEGWALCDGDPLPIAEYPELFKVIRTYFGSNDKGVTSFNLPDLRGRFIRGVSHDSGADPNKDSRTASGTNGNTGNKVGSYQADAFRDHKHKYFDNTAKYWNHIGDGGGGINEITGNDNIERTSLPANNNPGTETRPRNVYVNFIIKL